MQKRTKVFHLAVAAAMLLAAGGAGAAEERREVLLTDVAGLAGATAWKALDYETCDGIRGRLLYANWGTPPRQRVEIKLPCKGRYRISIGTAGTRYHIAESPHRFLVRLKGDPAPVVIDPQAVSDSAGWWSQVCEVDWKTADLDGDTLVVENMKGARAVLAFVRLVPAEEPHAAAKPRQRIVVTNDAYAPAADLDELLAPIMGLEGTAARALYFCVGQGAYTFAVPSKVAIPSEHRQGVSYENAYARDCAADYARLRERHPDLLDRLADFTHSIGLEFHVSFRTGCTVDQLEFAQASNAAEPGEAARGICRSECYCRLWDGTPVARFSYADDAVQDFFLRFYAEMLTEKVDGINLIWIRALPAMLFEPAFRDKFRTAYGEELARPDDPRVRELRARIMTDFHRRVRKLAGKRRLSVAVPAKGEVCEEFGLDVARLAREGLVDEVVVGDTLMTADHAESFSNIDLAYFRRACAGTSVEILPFLWNVNVGQVKKSLADGADGVCLWDACQKGWDKFLLMRHLADKDCAAAERWQEENPLPARVHPLKKLQGFDYVTYPWHVAY